MVEEADLIRSSFFFFSLCFVMVGRRTHTSQSQETILSLLSIHICGVTTLLVYDNDIIVIGNNDTERDSLQKCLATQFEINELGQLKYFLRIEVTCSKEGIFVSNLSMSWTF